MQKGLKHVDGKIIISINLEGKNTHKFSDGTVIRLERQYNNLNRRETEPVNAIVISGENIPSGVEILIHPNAAIESNKIYNYAQLSGKEEDSNIKYYSIPEEQCFFWRDGNEWRPLPPFETALRVFKPYEGVLEGIEPALLKDTLYVTSGELKGKVVATIKASDYVVIFQDVNGQEGQVLRFRPFGDPKTGREEEAIAILNDITDKVNNSEYWVGLTTSDAKPIGQGHLI